ncbi:MAG: glycoside hydrolase family 88 protein [Clostridia bacterium]|nr:glycoside hydrolase family 88 protein [Clostridia bacterium]
MLRGNIKLEDPERFTKPFEISKEKVTAALSAALDKLEATGREYGAKMPRSCRSRGFKYEFDDIYGDWDAGMYGGCYWLAYDLTGDKFFREMGEKVTELFGKRCEEKYGMNSHDIGFLFSPTAVAAYKLTGDEKARKIALEAARYLYEYNYSKEGKFIIRGWKSWESGTGCRTMMDAMLNAPLLFWAGKETGNADFTQAAIDHVATTEKLLVRADGSTYHHYQFNPADASPMHGLTLQGNSDESCWSRGQSWGVYGFPVAYSYTGADYLIPLHKDVSYYTLNHLPKDNITAWDYDFTDVKAVKDSSAGIISACGMYDMAKMLPDGCEAKAIYENAAAMILDSTIDTCTGDNGIDYDGLMFKVTGFAKAKKPESRHIEQIAAYGDYFYLEALARYYKHDFKAYW